MIDVTVHCLGQGSVDFNFNGPVGPDLDFALQDNFWGHVASGPPPVNGSPAAPVPPSRVPVIVVTEPPVTRTIEPVPRHGSKPSAVMFAAHDLVFDGRVLDRGPEKIFSRDLCRHFLAEHYRLRRRIDGHLKFRFLILLDSESIAAVGHVPSLMQDIDAVHAQSCIFRQCDLVRESAVLVRL